MNKKQLVATIEKSLKGKLAARDITNVVNEFMDTVKKEVKRGNTVTLVGFGTYKRTTRKARKGVNPATGEAIKIKAKKGVKFAPGLAFKQLLSPITKKKVTVLPTTTTTKTVKTTKSVK